MEDYLWHRVSEQEKQEIKEQAKKIMLDFGKAIEKLPDVGDVAVERNESVRDEGDGELYKPSTTPTTTPIKRHPDHPPQKQVTQKEKSFRDLMFENAPNKKDDCIVAERGNWVE